MLKSVVYASLWGLLCLVIGTGAVDAETPVSDAVGSFGIFNEQAPFPNVWVAGQPTPEQLQRIAAAGFKTVINLRAPGELTEWDEPTAVESLGMDFVSIPIAGQGELTEQTARTFDRALKEAEGAPVLVHCASSNRVGALYALRAFYVEGQSASDSLAIGKKAGLKSLLPMVEGLLASGGSGDSSP